MNVSRRWVGCLGLMAATLLPLSVAEAQFRGRGEIPSGGRFGGAPPTMERGSSGRPEGERSGRGGDQGSSDRSGRGERSERGGDQGTSDRSSRWGGAERMERGGGERMERGGGERMERGGGERFERGGGERMERGGERSERGGERTDRGSERGGSERSTRTDRRQPEAAPLVPGFGVPMQRAAPPGFNAIGSGSTSNTGSSRSSGASTSSTSSASASNAAASAAATEAARYRRYAEGLLRQYDENKNGTLEREEWSKMRGEPQKADKNGDGIITVDELAEQLSSFTRRETPQGDAPAGATASGPSRSSGGTYSRSRTTEAPAAPGSYRLLTASDRLPKGLPDWFLRADRDLDGQVTMAEFATSYDDATAARFERYDLNGDGIITAEECLDAERLAKR